MTAETEVRLTTMMQRAALLGVLGARFDGRFEGHLRSAPGTGATVEGRADLAATIAALIEEHCEIGAYISAMHDVAADDECVRVPLAADELAEELREAARRIHEFVNPTIPPEDRPEAIRAHLDLADAIEASSTEVSKEVSQ